MRRQPTIAVARTGAASDTARALRSSRGFTLVELIIVAATIMTLMSIAIPNYRFAVGTARFAVGMREMNLLMNEIDMFAMREGSLPLALDEVDHGRMVDPWGNPYQFLNFESIGNKGKGKKRKDRFLVPLNSTYDLYSMGPDGDSKPPLTAKASRDDIIRANDGDYLGPASEY